MSKDKVLEALTKVQLKYSDLLYDSISCEVACHFEDAITEIKELLDQPEQFKPDWVSYRQGVEDGINQAKNAQPKQEHVGIVKTIGGYPDNSQHTVELTGRHGDLRDGDLLYKAPPKQEPLSVERIADLWTDINTNSVRNFARAIEKAHGIGGGNE
jgi:hypothetical protein